MRLPQTHTYAPPPPLAAAHQGRSPAKTEKAAYGYSELTASENDLFDQAIPQAACCSPWEAAQTLYGLFEGLKKRGISRDYDAYPTLIDIARAPDDLWAVSDIHGDYDRFVKLACSHKLLALDAHQVPHWSGKLAILVVMGDMFDKGPKNLETLDLMQRLEVESKEAGGRVITLFGNHEVQFLADPLNDKAKGPGGLFWDLKRQNIDSKWFASDKSETGYWLRRLPFGVRVGDWFFAHGGQTSGRSFEGLSRMLEVALGSGGFKDDLVLGPNSLVRGRNWYGSDGAKGQENAGLMGVGHIVFGHDPDTIAPRGVIVGFPKGQRQLFRIDTGMSVGVNYSHGEMMHIRATEKGDVVQACGPLGTKRDLGVFKRP